MKNGILFDVLVTITMGAIGFTIVQLVVGLVTMDTEILRPMFSCFLGAIIGRIIARITNEKR